MTTTHLRQVRSYVRREARFTKGQKSALENLWPKYGLELKQEPLTYADVFGRSAPVILEIGFGMGTALLEMAKASPERDFIGIEVHRPGIATLLREVEEQGITNIRVFNIDANAVLEQCIANESLDEVLLYFPDPWPKKRHQKRRIVQSKFVELVCSKLKPEGVFHMATDWQDYAEHMMVVLSEASGFVNKAGAGNYIERPIHRPLTKFEARGQKLGHGVWDLVFTKVVKRNL